MRSPPYFFNHLPQTFPLQRIEIIACCPGYRKTRIIHTRRGARLAAKRWKWKRPRRESSRIRQPIVRSFIYEGKPQQALTESEKILQMAVQEGLPEWQAGTHSANCDIYIETGNFDKAEQSLAECRKVVTASQLSTAIKENFAKDALFDEAVIAAKRKDFTKATAKADEYRAKIEAGKDPEEMETHHALLGRIYFEKGSDDQLCRCPFF